MGELWKVMGGILAKSCGAFLNDCPGEASEKSFRSGEHSWSIAWEIPGERHAKCLKVWAKS